MANATKPRSANDKPGRTYDAKSVRVFVTRPDGTRQEFRGVERIEYGEVPRTRPALSGLWLVK